MRHLPNLLTLLRLLLTLPIAWLLLSERFAAALWLFAVAGASDALDGFLARRFGWVSRVGSVLDPLADKLLLVTSYVCLGLSQVLPWWLTLLVLLRDALIVGGALVYRVLVGALQMRPSLLGKASTLAQIILVLAVLLGLNWYLRRSLQPLEKSIDALQALAQGDASVHLPYSGNDEIGRIAQAVATFRRNAQELAATRALRERVRRRQERLLRTKLQALAQATQQPLELGRVGSDEEQLRQLAQVMNALSGRLIEQHQRLSGMVQELREALITKTRLAGLEQELQIAAQVQLSILPRHPPQDARLQLHCHIIPAREVGGDFYDYFFISPNALGFVIADVSGKGVPAALFMTITRTLLKATAQFIAEPTQCVTQLNDLLAAENEQMMFVTLFYGVLHLDTGTLHYVNAGHNPPYLLRTDGSVQPLARTGGMAVAVSEGMAYRAASVQLQPGEQLFLFTDGVTEAFNPQGQEFGEARLQQALLQAQPHTRADPGALTAQVLAQVHAFENGAAQADDITCMALRFGGPGTAA